MPDSEFPVFKCINCEREFDTRDMFFLNGVPYCPVDVIYPARARLYGESYKLASRILSGGVALKEDYEELDA